VSPHRCTGAPVPPAVEAPGGAGRDAGDPLIRPRAGVGRGPPDTTAKPRRTRATPGRCGGRRIRSRTRHAHRRSVPGPGRRGAARSGANRTVRGPVRHGREGSRNTQLYIMCIIGIPPDPRQKGFAVATHPAAQPVDTHRPRPCSARPEQPTAGRPRQGRAVDDGRRASAHHATAVSTGLAGPDPAGRTRIPAPPTDGCLSSGENSRFIQDRMLLLWARANGWSRADIDSGRGAEQRGLCVSRRRRPRRTWLSRRRPQIHRTPDRGGS
jgi:hypothetical protein